jgi:hypothetical protein
MYLLSTILFIGILIFLRLFYSSFMLGEDVYLYFYKVNSLELIVVLYIFLLLMLYALIKKVKLEFLLVQVLFTVSLLSIGEYTYSLFLQFVFLFILFESEKTFLQTFFLSLYLLALHKALLLLFSSSYLLYFTDFALLIYTIFLNIDILAKFKKTKILTTSIVLVLVLVAVIGMQSFIFDFYTWIDTNDRQNYQVSTVVYILSLLHILIFMIIRRAEFKLY